jgi:drug/metabolite transporter (DMT)-like permease
MASTFTTALFGLASAASWGAGDFSGGLATRRTAVLPVAVVSQGAAFAILLGVAFVRYEPIPALHTLAWGSAAGLCGVVGIASLYRALAVGVMGIAAPVSGVLAAAFPVAFAAFTQGLPTAWQITGFGLAMAGVWLVSRPQGTVRTGGLGLAVLSGIGFGGFYILISRAQAASVFWPLAASKATSLGAVAAASAIAARTRPDAFAPPPVGLLPLMLASGVLDAGGNVFFVLAEHAGRLDVASVLASLYPASTVMLARVVLRERLSPTQAMGVAAVLTAIPLIVG